MAYNKTRRE